MSDWAAPRPLTDLRSVDFDVAGVTFETGGAFFRTSGERVGQGGMGTVYHLDMLRPGETTPARAVGKLYRWEFLLQLRQDEAARRYFEHQFLVLSRLARFRHLHLLPVLAVDPISDNHLIITPYAGESLVSLVLQDRLSPAERVQMLLGAVRGLRAMHDAQLSHGDFTLRNILVHSQAGKRNSLLFDFDLSLALDVLADQSYASWYGGRIVGAPEYSLVPEQIDPVLEHALIGPQRDFYAVGTALYGLFSEASVYGDVADLPSLLDAIADGVVRAGQTRIPFPDEIPEAVRPIIVTCLERDPSARYPDCDALIRALELAAARVSPAASAGRFRTTLGYVQVERKTRLRDVFAERADDTISFAELQETQTTLARHGYVIEKSLGRVKGYPIHLAAPDPTMVATGRFPGNPYKKIVTAIDLRGRPDADAIVETWLGRIVPVLQSVRQRMMTALHKVIYDRPSGHLLLFSEYLEDARFGPELSRHELQLDEALGLGLIVAGQIARLHEHGLAHNNVTLKSLLFKCLPETGQVKPMFVGLVEPAFDPACMLEDVRRLAALMLVLLRRSRVTQAPPEHRARLEDMLDTLKRVAEAESTLTIGQFEDMLQQGLALIDTNFGVLRRSGGDVQAYAHLITRHALYRYLWSTPAAPPPVAPRSSGQSGSHS